MEPKPLSFVLLPIARALGQFDDPAFMGVVFRSVAWSVACLAGVYAGTIWSVHHLFNMHGWLAWLVDIVGTVGASLLAFWLFMPVAVAIGTFYIERIAAAVERRFYPWLPLPQGAPISEQVWDGLAVALKVLALNLIALVLAVLLPGIGLILGWMIAGYAIGRGFFVAVAMRRMPRSAAESLYRANRGVVLAQGACLALAAYVPGLNLLIPVIGIAAMIHVLDLAIATSTGYQRSLGNRFDAI